MLEFVSAYIVSDIAYTLDVYRGLVDAVDVSGTEAVEAPDEEPNTSPGGVEEPKETECPSSMFVKLDGSLYITWPELLTEVPHLIATLRGCAKGCPFRVVCPAPKKTVWMPSGQTDTEEVFVIENDMLLPRTLAVAFQEPTVELASIWGVCIIP